MKYALLFITWVLFFSGSKTTIKKELYIIDYISPDSSIIIKRHYKTKAFEPEFRSQQVKDIHLNDYIDWEREWKRDKWE